MKKVKFLAAALLVCMVLSTSGWAGAAYVAPPAEWDETTEIIVIGGGFAGLSAAYTAASNGASVVLIEKMPFVGGNSIINGGVYAAYTSDMGFHESLGLSKDSYEQHISDTIVGGDEFNHPELVKQMVMGSPYFLNAMVEAGLELRETVSRPGGHYGYRTYTTINQSGSDIVLVQQRLAQDAGVDMRVNSEMTYIFREEPLAGRVVGIQVEGPDGAYTLGAEQGVILATGGFGANLEMRQNQVPWIDETVPTTNHVGATGEGIQMAQAVGANTLHMAFIQLYPFADPNNGRLDPVAVIPFSGPNFGIVYVDAEGRRYVNEGDRRDVCSMAAIESGGFPTFSIFSEDMFDGFTTKGDLERGMERDRVFQADTLEELAAEINARTYGGESVNMDGSVLVATIAQHNDFIAQGEDTEFGKTIDPGITKPMLEGPYYAIPQWPSVHHTMGGVQINPRAEVVDIYGEVIPGLFAAGEVTGGVHGSNRLGSNAIPDAAVFGMIAGQVASTGTAPEFPPLD